MVQSSDKKRYVVLRLCDIRNKKKYNYKIDCVVICGCINLCTIAGVGVDYYVFSGFVQLVR